jgi:hypothetical protein
MNNPQDNIYHIILMDMKFSFSRDDGMSVSNDLFTEHNDASQLNLHIMSARVPRLNDFDDNMRLIGFILLCSSGG